MKTMRYRLGGSAASGALLDVGSDSVPTLHDVNGDGRLDLIVGAGDEVVG